MFAIILNKIKHKRWMVASLLIGNILLIAIACASPLYMDGILGRLLTRTLEEKLHSTSKHPLMVTIDSGSTTPLGLTAISLRPYDLLADEVPEAYGLDTLSTVRFISSGRLSFVPDVIRDNVKKADVQLATLNELEDHIKLLSGDLFSDDIEETADGTRIIDVIIPQRTMVNQNILLGDLLTLDKTNSSEILLEEQGALAFRVTGVFGAADNTDPYWIRPDSFYGNHLFMSEDIFNDLLRPGYVESFGTGEDVRSLVSVSGIWNVAFDYTQMKPEHVKHFLDQSESYVRQLNGKRSVITNNFESTLKAFELQALKTRVTLLLLQVPIYLLLLAFIFMVSKQLLRMELNEIAVFKSRGASRWQVLRIYIGQSLIIGLLALVAGMPLSFFLTNMIGSADAFLSFVSREALPLRIRPAFLASAGSAFAVSIGTMIIPAFRQSKTTIVEQKQQLQALDQKTPWWQKAWLDLILLGISIYALYSFNQQKDSIAERVAAGQGTDGLLFLSSSLFMVGAALVVWRIVPFIVRVFYKITENLWGPALYLSFLQTIRSRNRQTFISVFLMLTMSIGLFSAITARTINENARAQIRYLNGTDIVIREFWPNNAEAVADNPDLELVYQEPDYAVYEQMEEVEAVARVYTNNDVSIRGRNVDIKIATLMGIHTKEFGEAVKMDRGLLPEHINNYLNALAGDGRAVLLSENFRSKQGLAVGDYVYISGGKDESIYGVIAGFVPYWPGYQPTSSKKHSDGSTIVTDNYLAITHLSETQSAFGIVPYDLWLKTNGESQFIYDFAAENRNTQSASGRSYTKFIDTNAQLVDLNRDPILQGTNGLLTISYLVVLILCAVGFLIYWILSIRSRTLLFGIFRAMGLRFKELILMLINEQLSVTLPALLAGTGIGYLAARLFVPLILLAYGSTEQIIPLKIEYAGDDFIRTFLIVGMTIVLCLFVLAWQIRQINIAQALKLGED